MREFKGNSGAKIVINAAPFKVTKRLRQCFAKELLKQNIDIGNPKSLNALKAQFNTSVTTWVNLFKDVLLGLETSEEFEAVIGECFKECTYKQINISDQLFDDVPEAREDYDLIVYEIVKENLSPFFKGLVGKLKALNPATESDQPQS